MLSAHPATSSLRIGLSFGHRLYGRHGRYQRPFFIWFPALLAIPTALVLSRLSKGWIRSSLIGLATLCTALDFLAALDAGRFRFLHWRLLAWTPLAERSAAMVTSFSGQDYAEVLDLVPPGERIVFVGGNFSNIYPLYGPDLSRRLVFRNSEPGPDLLSELRKDGLRFVYLSQRLEMRAPHFEAYRQQLENAPFQRLTPGLYALPIP